MITISTAPPAIFTGSVEVFLSHFSAALSTFIGKVGDGPEGSLYLRTYNGIILLKTPARSWSGTVLVVVERFVDLEIKILNRR